VKTREADYFLEGVFVNADSLVDSLVASGLVLNAWDQLLKI